MLIWSMAIHPGGIGRGQMEATTRTGTSSGFIGRFMMRIRTIFGCMWRRQKPILMLNVYFAEDEHLFRLKMNTHFG